MLNKQNLIISVLAGEWPGGILISDNFTAATDGKVLAIVNRPPVDVDDFPSSPDSTPAQPQQGKFMIRKEEAEKLLRFIPKKTWPAILVNNIMPLCPLTGNSRRFLLGELGSLQIMTVNQMEEKFPSLKKHLWPKRKPKIKISFSINLLEKLLNTMKKGSTKRFPIVTLTLYDPDEAVKFQCELTDEGQKMTGLIIPCQPKNGA